ncbi:MAG: aspartyl/asparaginyl beta-hydroxylase domain-containing protein [Bacteroidota bacterium]
MQSELALLDASAWMQHYNKTMYEGAWTVLPLRSINGSLDNVISIHQAASTDYIYSDTALLQQCKYLQSVINYFECEKTAVRLMKLAPGATIKPHSDQELSFEEGEARFHIPVKTNQDVIFLLENERVIMQEGECWYLNLSLKHSVRNESAFERVHLVIDVRVNDWVRQLFDKEAVLLKHQDEINKDASEMSDQWKIIAELRRQQTETALQLAAKMEKDLVAANQEVYFKKALEFIHSIGIETRFTPLQEHCFLPGLFVENGRILVDREQLQNPGDILHEAAHIALMPAGDRAAINGSEIGNSENAAAEEMAAIAWTYAACVHLEIPPYFVFHSEGYKGGGEQIADNFREGRYFGVPILQWFGMTGTGDHDIVFPQMIKWKK